MLKTWIMLYMTKIIHIALVSMEPTRIHSTKSYLTSIVHELRHTFNCLFGITPYRAMCNMINIQI